MRIVCVLGSWHRHTMNTSTFLYRYTSRYRVQSARARACTHKPMALYARAGRGIARPLSLLPHRIAKCVHIFCCCCNALFGFKPRHTPKSHTSGVRTFLSSKLNQHTAVCFGRSFMHINNKRKRLHFSPSQDLVRAHALRWPNKR